MRSTILLLAALALLTVPAVAADDGNEEECVTTISYYCVEPEQTVENLIYDLKNGPPCTCDPQPQPW